MSQATKLKCDSCHSITNPRPYYRKGAVTRVDCSVCGSTLYSLTSGFFEAFFIPSLGLSAITAIVTLSAISSYGLFSMEFLGSLSLNLVFAAPAVLGIKLKKRALRNAAVTIERLTAAAR